MKSIFIFSVLATTSFAAPSTKSPWSQDVLQSCGSSTNCETYETSSGTMIRFKPGMEPGSADYAQRFPNTTVTKSTTLNTWNPFHKKRGNTITHVTFGSHSMNYGTVNPCDVVHHLYDTCHESACDTGDFNVQSGTLVRQGQNYGPSHMTLTLHPQGQYNGWSERDHFVDAVVAAASKGQKWTQHNWCIHTRDGDDCGTQWWGQQTSFVSVNKFQGSNLQGWMSVQVTAGDQDGDWCSKIGGIFASIAGAVNGVAGGFFGVVSAACN